MLGVAASDYGTLAPVVSGAGSLIAAGAAIGLAWRGRTQWEPSEEDVSRGPQKVGGLVATVSIALLWALERDTSDTRFLAWLSGALVACTVVALCVYSFLIATQTYEVVVTTGGASATRRRKIIGGFRLTSTARKIEQEKNLTTQEFLEGSAYDVDRVWTRASRALAKVVFVLCYLALTVSGTVALAGVAILVGHSAG